MLTELILKITLLFKSWYHDAPPTVLPSCYWWCICWWVFASCYNDMVLLVMLHFLQFLYVCRSLLPISLFIFFFFFEDFSTCSKTCIKSSRLIICLLDCAAIPAVLLLLPLKAFFSQTYLLGNYIKGCNRDNNRKPR